MFILSAINQSNLNKLIYLRMIQLSLLAQYKADLIIISLKFVIAMILLKSYWNGTKQQSPTLTLQNRIGDEMISVLTSRAVDCEFDTLSGQTIDYKIGICCFSAKHTALWRKSKDWLAWNQHNQSEWGDISTHRLVFQWPSTKNPTKHAGLVQSEPHHHFIEIYLVLIMI